MSISSCSTEQRHSHPLSPAVGGEGTGLISFNVAYVYTDWRPRLLQLTLLSVELSSASLQQLTLYKITYNDAKLARNSGGNLIMADS